MVVCGSAESGGWNLPPSEFWRMHPREFWWLYEAKIPESRRTKTKWPKDLLDKLGGIDDL